MAFLYIAEYKKLAGSPSQDIQGIIQTGEEPPLAEQKLAIGAGSVQSAELNSQTRFVMVSTDVICHVNIGSNPTASAVNRRLPADATQFYGIPDSSGFKLAVIQGT